MVKLGSVVELELELGVDVEGLLEPDGCGAMICGLKGAVSSFVIIVAIKG
jgi:hypothetical protein